MNRFLSVIAVAALWAPVAMSSAASARAAESKPVAIVSLAGYDALLADVDLIGELAGAPELKQGVEGLLGMVTRFQGLAGLSKDKPLGAAIMLGDGSPSGYVFLPVSDLDKLLDVFQDTLITETEEVEDGFLKIKPKNGPPLFVKTAAGWAFVSLKQEFLSDLPKDPAALLGNLPKKYDVAIQVNVGNVPEPLVDMAIDQMRRGAEQAMQRAAEKDPEAAKVQQALTETYLEAMVEAIKDLESYTVGVAIDNKTRSAYLDVEALMKEGSKLAKQVNASAAGGKPSKLPGLADAARVFNFHLNAPLMEDEIEMVLGLVEQGRAGVAEKIKEEIADADGQETVIGMVNDLFDVAEATIEGGHLNGGAVVTGEGPFSVVLAAHVVDGETVGEVLKKAAKMAENEAKFPEIEFDADEQGGVTFHTFDLPNENEEKGEDLEKFFGTDEPTVAIGISENVLLLAIGEDPVKAAAETLGKKSTAKLPLMQMQLKVGPIVNMAAQQVGEEQPLVGVWAGILKETDKDHINVTASLIKNGERFRLEIEEGLISSLGKLAMMASKGGAR